MTEQEPNETNPMPDVKPRQGKRYKMVEEEVGMTDKEPTKPEELRYLEDVVHKAWKIGKSSRGINATEEAQQAIEFLKRLGYTRQPKKEQIRKSEGIE